jgi:DNA-binding CsgD family transcriptional regulator
MTRAEFTDVLGARTEADLLQHLERLAHRWDFGSCDATAFIQGDDSPHKTIIVDNLPQSDEWRSIDPALFPLCPVMQHCKFQSTPVAWNSNTYTSRGLSRVFDAFSIFGLRSGICVSVHLPRRRFLQISLHSQVDRHTRAYSALLPELQSFAAHAIAPAVDIFGLSTLGDQLPELTSIEKEALRWAADGMPTSDIADRLQISESTAAHVLRIAQETLGCPNAEAASFRAIGLGII